LKHAFGQNEIVTTEEVEIEDVYKKHDFISVPAGDQLQNMRLVDAISNGLHEALKKFSQLVIMGQDIAEYGGVFKVTQGFADEFSKERIRNTPICESGIISTA